MEPGRRKRQGDQSRGMRGLMGARGTETGAAFSLQPREVTQDFPTGMDGQDLCFFFLISFLKDLFYILAMVGLHC